MTTSSLDARRKKLLFRCCHMGMKETDRLMGGFAEARIADLDEGQLDRLEALLEAPDPVLLDWITGRVGPPEEQDNDVLALIRAHHGFG